MNDQQNLFDGYEVQEDLIDVPGLGKLALAKLRDDLDVHIGDEFEARIRFRVGTASFGSGGFDKDGNAKGTFDRTFKAFGQTASFKVTQYLTAEEREATWRSDHGATA